MSTMKKPRTAQRKRESARIKQQAISLDRGIAALFRRYKLEPGVAAGSPYANLHANDVGLLVALASEDGWHVRQVAQMLGAPMTTVSSALDCLEQRKLLARRRRPGDRRVVYVELTARGRQLAGKIHASQVAMCAEMLAELKVLERKEMVRLVLRLAKAN
jgi:DNA-binding MarR family transcriptional regulator